MAHHNIHISNIFNFQDYNLLDHINYYMVIVDLVIMLIL